mmetsp:Transcript_12106/g.28935  ORF Transcript_12106/g.28935 Transcript_12106/m.28935 type:complete len:184 (+) Transcript_12106:236-787(+)
MREIMSAFPAEPSASRKMSPKAARNHVVMPNRPNKGHRQDLFLYLNALVLEETADCHPSTLAIYCSVTLFNTAILYHMEGMATGRMRFMDQAHQMYQASLHFLNGLDPWNDTVLLVNLAANNNLAHIELEKGMVDSANRRLGHTFEILQYAKSRTLGIVSGSELHGFLLNSSLQGKIFSAAAA